MAGYPVSKKEVKAPAFIVSPQSLKDDKIIRIKSSEHYHMTRVRRLGPGSPVRLVDGLGNLAHALIREVREQEVILEKNGPVESRDDLLPLEVFLSIIKGERMDLAISKLSEIGISQIQPVIASRTVTRLSGTKLEKKWQRWQSLSLHSLKQCRGIKATKILRPLDLKEVLSGSIECASKVVLLEDSSQDNLLKVLKRKKRPFPLTIAIGPEGGFSPEEKRLFIKSGFQSAGLGCRILRSETAAIFSASVAAELFRSGEYI